MRAVFQPDLAVPENGRIHFDYAVEFSSEASRDLVVHERFELPALMTAVLKNRQPRFGFNGLGAATYYRSYSRLKEDGSQESWADTVIRVVNGVFSLRKDWYAKHHLRWDDSFWTPIALEMADAIFEMRFTPPGRGLFQMGTDYLYQRGSMVLYNCAYSDTTDLVEDFGWVMDALFCGTGIGASTIGLNFELSAPTGDAVTYTVPDSREGWCRALQYLVQSYVHGSSPLAFDYTRIRPEGSPIKGFGGKAPGPKPLMVLIDRARKSLDDYLAGTIDRTRLVADIYNQIGCAVVSGNLRRSAEILIGSPNDSTFLNLKNYGKYDAEWNLIERGPSADREAWGWMSNNSLRLETHEDFLMLPEIAERIIDNGEPGFINLINIQKYGRLFRHKEDNATGSNPCGEIPLANKELCNLVETYPTRCKTSDQYLRTVYLATLYASTVSLLPTHRPETNEIIARNRRIGVGITGIADWMDANPVAACTRVLRDAYKVVEEANIRFAQEAGVAPSIRLTTVKPSGSVSLLGGVSSGMHWPTFQYAIRRLRVGKNEGVVNSLTAAGVPWEWDIKDEGNTMIFSFPIDQGKTRPATQVSLWEQAARLAMLQREWADNMVSNTLYFDPSTESKDVEQVLSAFAPLTKSLSMLPHTESGAYPQMPYEGIDEQKYNDLRSKIGEFDWSLVQGSDGRDELYCSNDSCVF